jgi:hypothetical protein
MRLLCRRIRIVQEIGLFLVSRQPKYVLPNINLARGTMLLAFICIAMIPIPIFLHRYGPQLREKQLKFVDG